MTEEEPKIIVDDNWKDQVQQEKDQARTEAEQQQAQPEMPPLPPASFVVLVSTVSTQAMAAMGFLNDPMTGQPNPNRHLAKHFIDTLGVLEEKTKGNLTPDEENLLTETLHQLRMAFVNVGEDKNKDTEDEGGQSPTIELP